MIKDLPNIEKVEASGRLALRIKFTRGGWKTVRLAEFIAREKAMSSLRNQTVFRKAMVSDWGGGVVWPGGLNLGASTLWRLVERQRRRLRESGRTLRDARFARSSG